MLRVLWVLWLVILQLTLRFVLYFFGLLMGQVLYSSWIWDTCFHFKHSDIYVDVKISLHLFWYIEGEISFFYLPLHHSMYLVVTYIPSQMMPNLWCYLIILTRECCHVGIILSLKLFCSCFWIYWRVNNYHVQT